MIRVPFLRTDDSFTDDERFLDVGFEARWLHVAALTHSARLLTDGHVRKALLGRLSDVPDPYKAASELVAAGLWEDAGDSFLVPSFLHWNKTAAQTTTDRAAARARQQRWLDKQRNASRDASQDASRDGALPNPPRPVGIGEEGEGVPRCERGYPIAADGACCGAHEQNRVTDTAGAS